MWPFDIPGLLGIGNLVFTEGPKTSSTLTSSPTVSPGDNGDRDRDNTVAAASGNTSPEGNSVNPGAFVAAGVAALTLVILALFVVRRRRSSDESLSKHRELADDDDGGMSTDDETMQNVTAETETPPRKSYIVGENESLQSWDSRRTGMDGQEVYVANVAAMDYRHSPHHMCSSPNCEMCEQKRQQGTRFVMADSGMDGHASFIPSESARQYEHEDTVDL